MPASFLLRTENPYRYNILFNDDEFIAEHRSAIEPLLNVWSEFRDEKIEELPSERGEGVELALSGQVENEGLFSEFTKRTDVTEAYTRLDRAFYWEPGAYALEFNVVCTRPNYTYMAEWEFVITEKSCETLRLNAVDIIRYVCGIQSNFQFAYLAFSAEEQET